LLISKELTI